MSEQEIMTNLAAPFPEQAIGWKAQATNGNRALAVAYIDARDVMDRLDAVMGVAGWKDEYFPQDQGTVACRLSLRIAGEWVSKEDIGGESHQPDPGDKAKAAYSDALKRAAVKWGIGRYLYSLPAQWVDYDPQKKQLTGKPRLPGWALPATKAQQAATPVAKPVETVQQLVQRWDATLVERKVSNPGALVAHLCAHLKAQHGGDMSHWPESLRDTAAKLTTDFVHARQADIRNTLFALLESKGQSEAKLLAALKLPADADARSLTAAQMNDAIARLKVLPDVVRS